MTSNNAIIQDNTDIAISSSIKLENAIVEDSVRLLKNIQKKFPPYSKWHIVNLAHITPNEDRSQILFTNEQDKIPPAFTYKYYETIGLLDIWNVFQNVTPSIGWYSGFLRSDVPESHSSNDITERKMYDADYFLKDMTERLRSEKLIDESVRVSVYIKTRITYEQKKVSLLTRQKEKLFKKKVNHNLMDYTCDYGESLPGQAVALVYLNDLENYLNYLSQDKPFFFDNSLHFLGQKIDFKGPTEIATIRLLTTNINRMVTHEEMYRLRGVDNYEALVKNKGKTATHDTLTKTFKAIRDKVRENQTLDTALQFVIHDGYGLFVNERANLPLPKIDRNPNFAIEQEISNRVHDWLSTNLDNFGM